jgi:hypothetical protein
MPLSRLRRRLGSNRHERARHERATDDRSPRWPVDPDLGRRVAETHARIKGTRRQLELHVLPERREERRHSGAILGSHRRQKERVKRTAIGTISTRPNSISADSITFERSVNPA